MRTTHRITTKHGSIVAPVMVITWLDFGEILLKTVIFANFLLKFRMCFFKVKHYFGHISGMVGPIDVKPKGSALVGYWVKYVTLTFDLPHDLDLGCFKVKFRNSSICRIVGLIDVEWNPWPWPWSFKVRVWNSFISGMGQPIDNERKGCESSIHDHDIDLCDHGGVGGCTG